MKELVFSIASAIGSIGTFIAALLALIKAFSLAAKVSFKTERLYGGEAERRFQAMLRVVPANAPGAFGPEEYRGGNRLTPQFELERFCYDQKTMPSEWKTYTRIARYFYKEGDAIFVQGWRL